MDKINKYEVDQFIVEVVSRLLDKAKNGNQFPQAYQYVQTILANYPFKPNPETFKKIHLVSNYAKKRFDDQAEKISVEMLLTGLSFIGTVEGSAYNYVFKRLYRKVKQEITLPKGIKGYGQDLSLDCHITNKNLVPFDEDAFKLAQEFSKYGTIHFHEEKEIANINRFRFLAKRITEVAQEYTNLENATTLGEKIAFSLFQGKHPPLIVLHGANYSGIDQCARDIQNVLRYYDYQPLNIDGRRFSNHNDESFILFGSPSVWSSSRQGMLTQFVHDNPKAAVVIHDADKMQPTVFSRLVKAFQGNHTILDEYGLGNKNRDGRQTSLEETPINFSQTVFIFTTTSGSHLYENINNIDLNHQELTNRAFSALDNVRFHHKEQKIFSGDLMAIMRAGIVPFPPICFNDRVKFFSHHLQDNLRKIAKKIRSHFVVYEEDLKACSMALLLSDYYNQQPNESIAEELIRLVFTNENLIDEQLFLKVKDEVFQQLEKYQSINQPQAYLRKRGKTLVPIFTVENDAIILSELREERIFHQRDHEGSVQLLANYPETRFHDIYGHDKIKAHLQEILFSLKSQDNLLQKQADKNMMQRGILLAGPPGVGKTLLAQAFAGEAKMAFVAVTGSDLLSPQAVSRLQELLENHSPCVVFIDEADSIPSRAHDASYAPAVNRLLSLIQGINTDINSAFWILASNYPDRLDGALLRAGRIEETLFLSPPETPAERLLYLQHFPIKKEYQKLLATITADFTGAMFNRLYRKLLICLEKQEKVNKRLLYQLVNSIFYGDEIDSLDPDSTAMVAHHEAGHAVASLFLEKDTQFLTAVLYESQSMKGFVRSHDTSGTLETVSDKKSIMNQLIILLAGRAAEEIIFTEASGGASSDLQKAGRLAYHAVAKLGLMPEETGLYISPFAESNANTPMRERYEKAAAMLVDQAWQEAKALLNKQEALLRALAKALLKYRLLDNNQLRRLKSKYGV